MNNVLNFTRQKFADKTFISPCPTTIHYLEAEREVCPNNRQFEQAGENNNMSRGGNNGRNREWKERIKKRGRKN